MNLPVAFAAGLALLTGVVSSNANPGRLPDALRDSLSAVSDSLFLAHRSEWLVLDALRDGYMEFDSQYDLSYDSSGVTVNGRRIEDEDAARYKARLRDFAFYGGNLRRSIGSGHIHGDRFSKAELLDPASAFRKRGSEQQALESLNAEQQDAQKIVAELVRDKLVDDPYNYSLEYGPQGLLVNKRSLPPEADAKYRMLFRIVLGIEPKEGKWGYSIFHTSSIGMK